MAERATKPRYRLVRHLRASQSHGEMASKVVHAHPVLAHSPRAREGYFCLATNGLLRAVQK